MIILCIVTVIVTYGRGGDRHFFLTEARRNWMHADLLWNPDP